MRRAAFAVAEQGTWSLAGFATSVVLARYLGLDEFGLFALALVALNGVGGFVNSLLLDPAQVVGPTRFDNELRRYGGLILTVALIGGALTAAVGAVAFLVATSPEMAAIAVGLVIALPTYVSWSARRLPYLTSEPEHALLGSIAYLLTTVGGLLAWNRWATLTVTSALLILGVAASAQLLVTLALWRPIWRSATDREMRRTARESHWFYGRWYLAAEASSWVLNNGFVGFSAAALSLGAAGGYRSSQVLMRPYGVVYQGLSMFYMPRQARHAREHGIKGLVDQTRQIGTALSLLASAIFVFLVFFGDEVLEIIFGPEFGEFGYVVAVMAGSMTVHAWIVAWSMALTAAEFPRDVFFGQLASAVTSVLGGLALGLTLGLPGLLGAMWIATIARAAVIYRLFRRRLTEAALPPEPSRQHPA